MIKGKIFVSTPHASRIGAIKDIATVSLCSSLEPGDNIMLCAQSLHTVTYASTKILIMAQYLNIDGSISWFRKVKASCPPSVTV